MSNTGKQFYEFGSFRVDPSQNVLLRDNQPVPLHPKAFDTLLILVQHSETVVLKDDLLKAVWPDTFVEESNLAQNIFVLRKTLGATVGDHRYIVTVPGRGYRFTEKVRVVSEEEESLVVEGHSRTRVVIDEESSPDVDKAITVETAAHEESEKRALRLSMPSRGWLFGGLVSMVCIALVSWFVPRHSRDRRFAMQSAHSIQSLAILPFENLSGDPSKEYFADGFTDELTTEIAERSKARVVSRTSVMHYKGSRKPLPEIARDLGVDAIVEGSVMISDQQLRITAHLIRTSDDRYLWAHSYERKRTDLFAMQSELAGAIANLVDGITSDTSQPQAAAASPRRFTAATYELALECRHLSKTTTKDGVNRAIHCYQHILSLDPNSAAAYAEMSLCYSRLADSKALPAAIQAIDLDSALPEAHLALADFKIEQIDLVGAEKEFQQAILLNPSYAEAHADYAIALIGEARLPEAMAEAKAARKLDPFSAYVAMRSGMILVMAGQYDKAIEEEQAALELDPTAERPHYWTGYAYEQKGRYKEAIAEYEKELPNDDHGIFLAAMGRSFVLSGDAAMAAAVRLKIEHRASSQFMWPYDAALFYAASGDKDRAFAWLDKEQKIHSGWLLFMRVDPRLSALRTDPRFDELARRLGLMAKIS